MAEGPPLGVMGTLSRLLPSVRIRDTAAEGERHATWLELFYDLVFVVAVAALAHLLSDDLTLAGLLRFLFLFVPVWYAWFWYVTYAERFDTDDGVGRVLTLIQMFAVAILAATIPDAFGDHSVAFALAYSGVRFVQLLGLPRCWSIDRARPLVSSMMAQGLLTIALWLISALVPTPGRYAVWALAIAFEIGWAWAPFHRRRYAAIPVSESHFPERFGLFTIIVLGESVAGIVAGLAGHGLRSLSLVTASLSLVLVFAIWWVYFENLTGTIVQTIGRWALVGWVYLHVPLMAAMTAAGVSLDHAIAADQGQALQENVLWLLYGSVAMALLAIGGMHFSLAQMPGRADQNRVAGWRIAGAAATTLLGALVVIAGAAPVVAVGAVSLLTLLQAVAAALNWDGSTSVTQTAANVEPAG